METKLNYLKTIIEENNSRLVNFFSFSGDKNKVVGLAKEKAKSLNGNYLILKNNSKNTIKVAVSFSL